MIRDSEGAVASYEGSLEDITERREAVAELEGERKKLRTYFDTMIDGVGIANEHGEIIEANESLVGMLGYDSRLDLIGMTIFDIAAVQDRPTIQKRFAEAIQDRTLLITGFETSYRRREGTEFPVLLNITNIWNEDGTLAGNMAVIRDITERKAAEQIREQLESQLRHAHKLQGVGELAAGVAHDFNSLLAVILGNAELAKRKLSTRKTNGMRESCTASVGRIVEAVDRGRSLVQKLLTFGRAQAWNPQPLDLNVVVEGMRQIFDSVLGSSFRLTVIPTSELRYIKGDAVQIEQVIMNLVLNARDAMPQGGELTIETANVDLNDAYAAAHAEAAPGPYVRLTVKDRGIGINAEYLDRIFDPFFSTKFPEKGTGLGLSIVHGIVKQAGGHITVESQPDSGTTFALYFPSVD